MDNECGFRLLRVLDYYINDWDIDNKCGFRLDGLCYCEDMECYGTICTHMDATTYCPVHVDPDDNKLDNKNPDMLKINACKQEIDDLKAQIELQQKIINDLKAQIELSLLLIHALERIYEC